MMLRSTLGAVLVMILTNATMVLANDLEVRIVSGDVIVNGDSDANDLEIVKIYSYVHQFRGLNGTTIHGSSEPLILPILDDLRIQMDGGDDFVHIRSIYLRQTSHADLIVRLGKGDDEILIRSGNVSRNVKIIDDLEFQGNDAITVKNCQADTMYVETQGSADIGVLYNDCSWLYVESGREGADSISAVGNGTETMHIYTSDEDDDLVFVGNKITGGYGMIELSDGDDFVQSSINELSWATLTIDGGRGRDTGTGLKDWPWWYAVKIVSFE